MRGSYLKRVLGMVLAGAGWAHAADPAGPDATEYLPRDAVAVIRLHDVPRMLGRFTGTPYAQLLDTAWGRLGRGLIEHALAKPGIDSQRVLGSLREVTAGIAVDPSRLGMPGFADVGVALDTAGDDAPIRRLCGALFPVDAPLEPDMHAWAGGSGQVTRLGSRYVFRTATSVGPMLAPRAEGTRLRATFPEDCVEAELHPAAFARFLAALGHPGIPEAVAATVSVAVRLDAIGVRERVVVPFPSGQAAALGGLSWPVAPRGLLAGLPPTTLSAVVLRADPTLTARGIAAMKLKGNPALARLDRLLDRHGLPGWSELATAIDGDLIAWIEEGVPFPHASCMIGLRPEVAARVLATLQIRVGMVYNPDGSRTGIWGMVVLHADYRDGRLLLTTNPAGLAAMVLRPGGFTAHPEIQAALGEIPGDTLIAGVSRSGASYGALGQLLMLPLSQLNLPELMSLPQDLRKAGRHGFLAYRLHQGAMVLDSGGLLGGPCCLYGLIAGVGIGGALLLGETPVEVAPAKTTGASGLVF